MLQAFGLGFAAQSSLILCGPIVFWVKLKPDLVGWLGGTGPGTGFRAVLGFCAALALG